MEVPDMSVNLENWVSPANPVSDFKRVYDANMSTPGAAISGCTQKPATYRQPSPHIFNQKK